MEKILSEDKLKSFLNFPLDVKVFDSLESTNSYAKNATCGAIFALSQTGGRGRKEKTFFSGEGGLYFSLSFPREKNSVIVGGVRVPLDPARFTLAAGIAVSKALNSLGYEVKLKWVNDVFYGGKKVCGILAESTADKVVVGIGVNLDSTIPKELNGIATSLRYKGDFNVVAADIINRFMREVAFIDMRYYNDRCMTLRKIVATKMGEGRAVSVDEDGALVVDIGGTLTRVYYGEAEIK